MFGSINCLIRRQGYSLDYVVVALRKKFARLLLPKLFENDFIEGNMADVDRRFRNLDDGCIQNKLTLCHC